MENLMSPLQQTAGKGSLLSDEYVKTDERVKSNNLCLLNHKNIENTVFLLNKW